MGTNFTSFDGEKRGEKKSKLEEKVWIETWGEKEEKWREIERNLPSRMVIFSAQSFTVFRWKEKERKEKRVLSIGSKLKEKRKSNGEKWPSKRSVLSLQKWRGRERKLSSLLYFPQPKQLIKVTFCWLADCRLDMFTFCLVRLSGGLVVLLRKTRKFWCLKTPRLIILVNTC